MNIVICVKAVPMKLVSPVDAKSTSFTINPYDLWTLSNIVQSGKKYGWNITCLCMGSLAVKDVLFKCYALGADNCILLSDVKFAGSDTYATSYILSKALALIPYDFIVCGREAIDGETGQIGCSLATWLDIPYVQGVQQLKMSEAGNSINIHYKDNSIEYVAEANQGIPMVLAYSDFVVHVDINLMALKRAQKKEIIVWDTEVLMVDPDDCGQAGSKTKVVHMKPNTASDKNVQFISGTNTEKAKDLLKFLSVV